MLRQKKMVQLNKAIYKKTPALTDFKGPNIFFCYRRISVIANNENKEQLLKGLTKDFCYKRISVTSGSVTAGFNCI